jgi:outer membrane protein TolC
MAKKGYEKGANSYLELLEAQRTLRSTKSNYYSALAEYAKALAQLEWAIGCPISAIRNTEAKK